MATELRCAWQLWNAINQLHIQRLDAIKKYSGRSENHLRTAGGRAIIAEEIIDEAGSDKVPDADLEDGLNDEFEKLTDFVLAITD